jgi:hypothetical protein
MAAAIALLAVAAPRAGAGPADRDLELEQTPIIVEHDYVELPDMGANGAMGLNLIDYPGYSVANQRAGDVYVRAGIVRDDPALIERGFDAFDHAFSRQRSDGSFPDAEQAEEYAFFIEAVAHSVLLLREAGLDRYDHRLDRYVRRLEDAVPFVVGDRRWRDFRYRNRFYTHSAYVMGSALTLLGELTGGDRATRHGREAIEMGLTRQRSSGVNPELGGYDVRYHMVGLVYAERFAVYFPRSDLAARVGRMVGRGLSWMSGRIRASGWIDWVGSTRACREISLVTGRPKTPGYDFTVRGFAYWGEQQHVPAFTEEATAAHSYAAQALALCGPEAAPTAAGPEEAAARPEEEAEAAARPAADRPRAPAARRTSRHRLESGYL